LPISKPNPEKVAAERLKKDTAGEKSSPAVSESPQQEPPREKRKYTKRSDHWSKPDVPKEIPRTAEDIKNGAQMCAFLVATLWGILAPFIKHRDITDQEALQLGSALDPVLYKYLPGLSGYTLEINLLLVVGTVWQATAITGEKIDQYKDVEISETHKLSVLPIPPTQPEKPPKKEK